MAGIMLAGFLSVPDADAVAAARLASKLSTERMLLHPLAVTQGSPPCCLALGVRADDPASGTCLAVQKPLHPLTGVIAQQAYLTTTCSGGKGGGRGG